MSGKTIEMSFAFWTFAFAAIKAGIGFGILLVIAQFAHEEWHYWTAAILFLYVFTIPMRIAMNVHKRIPKEHRPDYKIQHPYLFMIIVINVVFGLTGLGYLAALAWACSPGRIELAGEDVIRV